MMMMMMMMTHYSDNLTTEANKPTRFVLANYGFETQFVNLRLRVVVHETVAHVTCCRPIY